MKGGSNCGSVSSKMRNMKVQQELNKAARQFCQSKKAVPQQLLDEIVAAMDEIGGISGFSVATGRTMTVHNHADRYTLQIRFKEYAPSASCQAKRYIAFLELFRIYLIGKGISQRNMEFHLGKHYSSKHHGPF